MGLYLLSRGPHCESPWTNGQITSGQWRLGSRGTRSYQERGSRKTTFIGPSPLYFTTVSLSLSLSFFLFLFSTNYPPHANPARFCTIPLPESSAMLPSASEKRIRRYTSLPRNFPPLTLLSLCLRNVSADGMNIEAFSPVFEAFKSLERGWFFVCFNGGCFLEIECPR